MKRAGITAGRYGAALAALVTYLLLTFAQRAFADAPKIDPNGNGTDLWSNIAPADLGGKADQYPLSAWRLDFPFDAVSGGVGIGGVDLDLSGIPALALHAIAGVLWQIHVEISKGVLTLFSWAFGANLLDDRYGVLAPIAQVTTDLYDALGPLVPLAVLGLGAALTWRLFVRRDVGGTVGQLMSTIAAVTIAMLFVTNPTWTAQFASGIARNIAGGLLSVTNARSSGESSNPRIRSTDALWGTLVANPWVVMEFGGLEHCVDENNKLARPGSRECKTTIDHREKYRDAFLNAGNANGGTRKALYEALATGETPTDERIEELKADSAKVKAFKVNAADKPASDLMGRSGAEDRLAVTPLILLGGLGANLMIGAMAATQLVMQIYFLLLLSLSAVMLLAAMIPGRPQAAFRAWLGRLIGALLKQVVIAVILGVAVAVASALTNAGAQLGWLFTFLAQAVFWWALFFYRRELAGVLSAVAPSNLSVGHSREDDGPMRTASRAYRRARYSNVLAGSYAGSRSHQDRDRSNRPGLSGLRDQLNRQNGAPAAQGPARDPESPSAPSSRRSVPTGTPPVVVIPPQNGSGNASRGSDAIGRPRAAAESDGNGKVLRFPPLEPNAERPGAPAARNGASASNGNGGPPRVNDGSDADRSGGPSEAAAAGPGATLSPDPSASSRASNGLDNLDEELKRDRARFTPEPAPEPTPGPPAPRKPAAPPKPTTDQGGSRPKRSPRRLPPDGPTPGGLESRQPRQPPREDDV